MLSEVGSKDDTGAITPPYRWVEQMREELAAGAWKVIAEGREAGTAGIFRPNGEVREGLIDEIVHEIDVRSIMFDAPVKHQQVWFIRRFGPEVNLGNIAAGGRPVAGDAAARPALGHARPAGTCLTPAARWPPGEQVVLVRHGQTDDNREPVRVQGFSDTPLNDTGRAQARAAARADRRRPAAGLHLDLRSQPRPGDRGDHRRRGRARAPARRRGCGRPTAGGGRGGCSPTSSATSRSGSPPGARAGAEFRFPGGESLLEQQQRVQAAVEELRGRRAAAGARRLPRRRDPGDAVPRRIRAGSTPSTTSTVPNLAMVAV